MQVEYGLSIEDAHGKWHKFSIVLEDAEIDQLVLRKFGQEIESVKARAEYASMYAELMVLHRCIDLNVNLTLIQDRIHTILGLMDELLDTHSVL